MKGKKIIVLCLSLLVWSLCLSACEGAKKETESTTEAAGEADEKEVLHLSIASAAYMEGVITGEVLEKYMKELEEWSDGRIKVVLYDEGALGSDAELMPGVVQGTLTIVNAVSSAQVKTVPEAALLGLPCIFEDTDQFNGLMESDYWNVIQGYYNKAGLQLLTCFADNYRNLTTNVEVDSIGDLKGLKMRTLDNPYHIAFWNALGMDASYYNFNDLYTALQQNVYDAQENPNTAIVGARLYEVQKYVINTRHTFVDNVFVMNKEQWDALSLEQQELVQRFFDEVRNEQIALSLEEYRKMDETLAEEEQMTIIEPSERFLEELQTGKEAALALVRQDLGDQVVDEFLAAIEALDK